MDCISPNRAVDIISSRRRRDERSARQILIAALAEGRISAYCEAYWTSVSVGSHVYSGKPPYDNHVPMDFWSIDHADHFDTKQGSGRRPGGHWGDYTLSRFHSSVCMTATAGAGRYREFDYIALKGSAPAWFEWEAIGVAVYIDEIERLMLKTGPELTGMVKRFRSRQAFYTGRPSKDDIEIVKARFAVSCLAVSDQMEVAVSVASVKKYLWYLASTTSEEQALTHRAIDRFAAMVVSEAEKMAVRASNIAPGSDELEV